VDQVVRAAPARQEERTEARQPLLRGVRQRDRRWTCSRKSCLSFLRLEDGVRNGRRLSQLGLIGGAQDGHHLSPLASGARGGHHHKQRKALGRTVHCRRRRSKRKVLGGTILEFQKAWYCISHSTTVLFINRPLDTLLFSCANRLSQFLLPLPSKS